MRSTSNAFGYGLLFGLVLVLFACSSEHKASQEEIDNAVEAISTEAEIQYKEKEAQDELQLLNEEQVDAYKKAEEVEKEKREATIAASPYLTFADDKQAILDYLESELSDAQGDCVKVNAFMDLWKQSLSDPIFIALKKDKQYRKPLSAIYTKAVKLKDNCKNP